MSKHQRLSPGTLLDWEDIPERHNTAYVMWYCDNIEEARQRELDGIQTPIPVTFDLYSDIKVVS